MGEAYIINIGIDKPTYLYVIYCKKKHTVYQIIYLSTRWQIYIYILHICRQLLHFMTCNPILKLMRDMDVSIMRGMGEK